MFSHKANNYVLGKLLRSDALKRFLEDVGHDRMSGLHPTINNSDRIKTWIHKERLLINPFMKV